MRDKECCRGCDGYSGCDLVCQAYLGIKVNTEVEKRKHKKKVKGSKGKEKTKAVVVCRNCGKTFVSVHGKKYCSEVCQKAQKNARKREARRKAKCCK